MLKTFAIIALMLCGVPAFAGSPYTYSHNGQQLNNYNSALLSKVIVQNKIQVFDTQLLTPHKQFFRVIPQDPYIEQIVIERIITPKEYIYQEQVVGNEELIQRYVAPERQTVIVEQEVEKQYYAAPVQCIQKFRSYCNQY